MSSIEAFWASYQTAVAALIAPLEPDDGCEEAQVNAAERRLGFLLPPLLRRYYLLTGRHPNINLTQNYLVAPEFFRVEAGVLVFLDENQACCRWGVRVTDWSDEDPVVLVQDDADSEDGFGKENPWVPEGDHLTGFLFRHLVYQCALGGANWYGSCDPPPGTADILSASWLRFKGIMGESEVLFYGGGIACKLSTRGRASMFVGAGSEEAILNLADELDCPELREARPTQRPAERRHADLSWLRETQEQRLLSAQFRSNVGDATCSGCLRPLGVALGCRMESVGTAEPHFRAGKPKVQSYYARDARTAGDQRPAPGPRRVDARRLRPLRGAGLPDAGSV